MAKYRKKPVVIEAFLLGVDDEPEWFKDAVKAGVVKEYNFGHGTTACKIRTLEGEMVRLGGVDYIIRGVEGELYPCKPDIFEKTYERVTDDENS